MTTPIIPVLVLDTIKQADKISEIAIKYAFHQLEVTLRTDCAMDILRHLKEHYPQLSIGAGTIMSVDQAKQAIALGCDFIVSPGYSPNLLHSLPKLCQQHSCLWYPGVATISEAMTVAEAGIDCAKLFPATLLGGTTWLKNASSVLPHLNFFPTGGISAKTASDFLSLANVSFIGGSWLAPQAMMQHNQWTDIERHFQAANELLRQ